MRNFAVLLAVLPLLAASPSPKPAKKAKPTAAALEEAERRMARGAAGVKHASAPADFKDAAAEFEAAAAAVPDMADAYYNAGVTYAKAGEHAAAVRNLRRYIELSPKAADIKAAKAQLAEEEFLIEKAAKSPEVLAARQAAQDAELMRSLQGAVFYNDTVFPGKMELQFRVDGDHLQRWYRRLGGGYCLCDFDYKCNGPIGEELMCPFSVPLKGRRAEIVETTGKSVWEISPDGQSMTLNTEYNGGQMRTETYRRR